MAPGRPGDRASRPWSRQEPVAAAEAEIDAEPGVSPRDDDEARPLPGEGAQHAPSGGTRPGGRRRPGARAPGAGVEVPSPETGVITRLPTNGKRPRSAPPPRPVFPEEMAPPGVDVRGRGTLRHDAAESGYIFTIGDVSYRVPTDGEAMQGGLLCIDGRIGDAPWTPLLSEAGMLFRDAGGGVLSPPQARERLKVTEFRAVGRGKTLSLRYVETVESVTLRRALQIRLVGQTLVIQPQAGQTAGTRNYCGFSLGPLADGKTGPSNPASEEVSIPYCPEPLVVLPGQGFLGAYFDRLKSSANAAPRGTAFYRANSAGVVQAIQETIFLTLSRDPLAVLPRLPQPASPHRALLDTRLFLDLWSEARYSDDRARVEELARYGLRDICLVIQNWRHFGSDRRLPSHYPANPERGSNEEFRRLVETARDQGWLVAIAEEYAAISQDSAYWDPHAVAHHADGSFRPGIRQQWAIAADEMLGFARLEALQIRRNYGPNAAFLGANVAWHPEEMLHQVDLDAQNALSQTIDDAVGRAKQLAQFARSVYEGPVLGQGGEGPGRFDTYYAGYVDGVERRIEGGQAAPVIPDYELREVKPRMANYGMGLYGRFFPLRSGHATIDPNEVNWDCYRATQIAYGHAGFLSTGSLPVDPQVKWTPCGRLDQAFTEYFMLRALQEQYLTAPVREVAYWTADGWLDLGQALMHRLDLTNAQLRIEYENGLTVWVNRHPRAEWSVRAGGDTYLLPPNGWLGWNAEPRLLTYSALASGGRADVMLCDAYRFFNARSSVARRIEGITTDGAAAVVRSAVPERWDLFLVGGRTLAEGVDLIKASERADFSVIHRSEREVELMLLDSESGRSCNVTLHYFSDDWHQTRLGLQERFEDGWRRAANQVQHTRRGVQIARMMPGVVYRLFLP